MTTNTAQAAAKRTTPLIMTLAEYEAIPESYGFCTVEINLVSAAH